MHETCSDQRSLILDGSVGTECDGTAAERCPYVPAVTVDRAAHMLSIFYCNIGTPTIRVRMSATVTGTSGNVSIWVQLFAHFLLSCFYFVSSRRLA